MKHISVAAAVTAAVLLVTQAAGAQERPAISLMPAGDRTWDLAGHAGWSASHKPDIGAEWDDWYNAFAGGVSAGRYLTPNVKAEIHAVEAREGRIYSQDPISPADAFPAFRPREHYFRTTSIGASVSYQFFENQWFHPFAGGGLEVIREHHRVEVPQHFQPPRGPGGSALTVPAVSFAPEVTYSARPFLTTGFKWYVAERAFMRATLQVSIGRCGAAIVFTAGIGADL
jgi:hypothetical protein